MVYETEWDNDEFGPVTYWWRECINFGLPVIICDDHVFVPGDKVIINGSVLCTILRRTSKEEDGLIHRLNDELFPDYEGDDYCAYGYVCRPENWKGF